jgi:exodeoxyribonuclease V alpha subunit
VPIPYTEARQMLKLAFCITIHKSQGSEYDYVILPFVKSYGVQLQRNLLYTAITRARTRVFILGDWAAIAKAVVNNEVVHRNTVFDLRLKPLEEQ